jgi:phosphomethylpyrimidine synthase
MTQLEMAKNSIVSSEMELVAKAEQLDPEIIRHGIALGTIVIPANINHKHLKVCGIGKGLRTKVNANIGTSSDYGDTATELHKLEIAVKAGADAIMDLSTGGNLTTIRQAILLHSYIPVGTVPIYQATIQSMAIHNTMVEMTENELFQSIETHCEDGVDFITVHCGVTQRAIALLKQQGRIANIVSRGGAFLMGWMLHNGKENPLYQYFDRLLDIALKHDVTLSLGDGLRPGCLADATDRAQVEELVTLGELVQRAREAGVQTMVEGPGHLPITHIEANVLLQKSLCQEAPFYVLGPLVTDIAAGYDHITGAIGGAIAAAAGADFLCYVTPAEHLALPDPEDVRQGVIASRIAAHAADIAKEVKGATNRDKYMSVARKKLNWAEQAQYSLDPQQFERVHGQHKSGSTACSMCGKYCAMQIVEKELGISVTRC